ncbi:MAG: hypothetical protein ACRDQD_11850, partial [Nocardioidaceae bacterium]
VDVPEAHIRLDGRLRANAVPVTPAVRVCFTARHNDIGDVAYGTDVFSHWRDNVRAVALGLQALRQVDRYGITRDSQQYKGFKAIASGAGSREAAAITLERIAIGDDPEQAAGTVEAIQRRPATAAEVWREARKIAHPDRNGGDRRLWDDVENAARVLGLTGNANRVEVREG